MSIKYCGKSVSKGIAMAELRRIDRQKLQPASAPTEDVEQELNALDDILQKAEAELLALYDHALEKLGPKQAEIFDAHLTLLKDDISVGEPARVMIREKGCNAITALTSQLDAVADLFHSLGDELMAARADDITDLKDLVIHTALGIRRQDLSQLDHDVILLADELVPSDTVRMDTTHVVGLATRLGGETSHTAIIARALGIPAVVGLTGWEDVPANGVTAILDGIDGTLTLDPSPVEAASFRREKSRAEKHRRELDVFCQKPTILQDGIAVELCANIGSTGEAETAMCVGAEGVGLFRSEFLFMDRNDLPTEEEQFEAYRKTVETMKGRPVIVRTLDIGGDKSLPSLELPREDNPFLGYRAIRMTLDRPDIFRPQLRALLRASAYGDLRVMFPMISGLEELRAAKAILCEERAELERSDIPVGGIKVGIMIEIPSAALMAHSLAAEVDFFSIGTNDLIQYTLAAERGNERVSHLYTVCHPAVLELIARTAQAAKKHGIVCGMCGEAAGDESLAAVLVGMGITELSMNPRQIPAMRKLLSQVTLKECEARAQAVLRLREEKEVQEYLRGEPMGDQGNCPICGRNCPIEALSCNRGRELAAKLKEGEPVDIEALRSQNGHGGQGHNRGRHRNR